MPTMPTDTRYWMPTIPTDTRYWLLGGWSPSIQSWLMQARDRYLSVGPNSGHQALVTSWIYANRHMKANLEAALDHHPRLNCRSSSESLESRFYRLVRELSP